MKVNVSFYDVMNVVFIVIFILIILSFIVAILVSIISDVQISRVPIEYGYVVLMDVKDNRGLIPRYVPTVKISYDVTYKGNVHSFIKTYNITAEQFEKLNCGDIIYFDNNNMPIFPSSVD